MKHKQDNNQLNGHLFENQIWDKIQWFKVLSKKRRKEFLEKDNLEPIEQLLKYIYFTKINFYKLERNKKFKDPETSLGNLEFDLFGPHFYKENLNNQLNPLDQLDKTEYIFIELKYSNSPQDDPFLSTKNKQKQKHLRFLKQNYPKWRYYHFTYNTTLNNTIIIRDYSDDDFK